MVNLIKGECYWKSPRITFSQNCVFFFYKELKINEKRSDYKKDSKSFIIYIPFKINRNFFLSHI